MSRTMPTTALVHRQAASARTIRCVAAMAIAAVLGLQGLPATAQESTPPPLPPETYADLADLSDASQLVVRARVTKQAELEPERAAGVAPGHVRLYLEAETLALIAGNVPVGAALRYLVDVPRDARGRAPKLRKNEVLLFARAVPGQPGAIQLVAPDSQLAWSTELEARLRPILAALVAPDAPPKVTGIRDALSIAGNLTGESETQMFLRTQDGAPLALSVVRRPGGAPAWGVSYSEIVDQAVRRPEPQSLGWYRLACFLPPQLPGGANLSTGSADRARADTDYRFVIEQLGPCQRTRTPPPGL